MDMPALTQAELEELLGIDYKKHALETSVARSLTRPAVSWHPPAWRNIPSKSNLSSNQRSLQSVSLTLDHPSQAALGDVGPHSTKGHDLPSQNRPQAVTSSAQDTHEGVHEWIPLVIPSSTLSSDQVSPKGQEPVPKSAHVVAEALNCLLTSGIHPSPASQGLNSSAKSGRSTQSSK